METEQVVRIYKSDSIKEISDEYGFSKSDISGIEKVFRTSDCYSIFAGNRENIGSYCVFDDGGTESEYVLTETGLIYFADAEQAAGRDVEDLLHACAMGFNIAFFIDERWIYYESFIGLD